VSSRAVDERRERSQHGDPGALRAHLELTRLADDRRARQLLCELRSAAPHLHWRLRSWDRRRVALMNLIAMLAAPADPAEVERSTAELRALDREEAELHVAAYWLDLGGEG